MSAWDELDRVLAAYDSDFEVSVATACAWSGQLRITITNPEGQPSRSLVFFSAGQASAEGVAQMVLDDLERCLEEGGVKPLPPPTWMFED